MQSFAIFCTCKRQRRDSHSDATAHCPLPTAQNPAGPAILMTGTGTRVPATGDCPGAVVAHSQTKLRPLSGGTCRRDTTATGLGTCYGAISLRLHCIGMSDTRHHAFACFKRRRSLMYAYRARLQQRRHRSHSIHLLVEHYRRTSCPARKSPREANGSGPC